MRQVTLPQSRSIVRPLASENLEFCIYLPIYWNTDKSMLKLFFFFFWRQPSTTELIMYWSRVRVCIIEYEYVLADQCCKLYYSCSSVLSVLVGRSVRSWKCMNNLNVKREIGKGWNILTTCTPPIRIWSRYALYVGYIL